MKIILLCILNMLFYFSTFGQVEVNVGYNLGLNTYVESMQDNRSTQFNLGWDFDKTMAGSSLEFVPKGESYSIKNPMNWNKITRGIILGFGVNKEKPVSIEFNFVGCTNKETGKRQNISKNLEESLTIKTKFGGIQFLTLFNIHKRFSLNVGIGVNLFRTRYSWSGEIEVKNQMMGNRSDPFKPGIRKPGDKDLTLIFPVGFTATLFYNEQSKIALKARLNYNFVWNSMVQTETLYYYSDSYNLSGASLGIILSKTF